METYQPIFDAVRSKISNGDIGAAVEAAMRDANISHHLSMAMTTVQDIASEHQRPCAVFRPKLSIDGNQWCALYGDNLRDGCVGFGDSPASAMLDFDKEWSKKLGRKHA